MVGGAEGDRTPDLDIANVALSQLSYGPWCAAASGPARVTDTGWPRACQGAAAAACQVATGGGLEAPLRRIAAIGQAYLEDNLARIKEVARSISPDRPLTEIVEEIGRNHPQAQDLIPETRDMLADIRQSLIDYDVISVPSADRCHVIETPTYMRYAFAAMATAAPFQTKASASSSSVSPLVDYRPLAQSATSP